MQGLAHRMGALDHRRPVLMNSTACWYINKVKSLPKSPCPLIPWVCLPCPYQLTPLPSLPRDPPSPSLPLLHLPFLHPTLPFLLPLSLRQECTPAIQLSHKGPHHHLGLGLLGHPELLYPNPSPHLRAHQQHLQCSSSSSSSRVPRAPRPQCQTCPKLPSKEVTRNHGAVRDRAGVR